MRRAPRPFRRLRLALLACCCLAGGTTSRAASLREQGVTVEFEPRDGAVARRIPGVVRLSGDELRARLGLELPASVRVRLLRRGEAFLGLADGEPVELYAGVAYPRTGTIHLDARRLGRMRGDESFLRTTRHECVHLAVGHTLGEGRLPKWFEEGLACHFGSPLPSAELEKPGPRRAFRLSSLTTRFPPPGRATRVALRLAYAQVESVLNFVVRERGDGALREITRRVAGGEAFEKALTGATGFTVETLEEAWLDSLRPHWGWRMVVFLFSPGKILLWAALVTVAGYFVVRRRRRRQAEVLDDYV